MKRRIAIHLSAVLFFILLISCGTKREIEISGLLYKGEIVIVKYQEDTVLMHKVEGCEKPNSICDFYKKINLHTREEYFHLKITVDSNNFKVLDTNISFSKEYKRPFISIVGPPVKKSQDRHLTVGDQGSKDFPNY